MKKPPPIPAEARTPTPPPTPVREELSAIAMDRADEVLHLQNTVPLVTAAPQPVAKSAPAPVAPALTPSAAAVMQPSISLAKKWRPALRLGIAACISLAVFAIWIPAFRDALRGKPEQESSGRPAAVAASRPEIPAVQEIARGVAGFSLLVDSRPAGANVFVNSQYHGRTPSLMNLQCIPGQTLTIRIEKPGYEPYVHEDRCYAGRMIKVNPILETR